MWPKIRTVLLQRLRLRESWIFFFVLGFIMINHPFIDIFDKPYEIFGIPLFFLYLYCGWALSIIVIYLFVSTINLPDDSNDKGVEQ